MKRVQGPIRELWQGATTQLIGRVDYRIRKHVSGFSDRWKTEVWEHVRQQAKEDSSS